MLKKLFILEAISAVSVLRNLSLEKAVGFGEVSAVLCVPLETHTRLLIVYTYLLFLPTSRRPPVCRAVCCRALLCGAWFQPWAHSEARGAAAVVDPTPAEVPPPTCETGSIESGDHTPLPLHSHRSVSLTHTLSLCLAVICAEQAVCSFLRKGKQLFLMYDFNNSATGFDVGCCRLFLIPRPQDAIV